MIELGEIKKEVEERYGVVTHLTTHFGDDAFTFRKNGYEFLIYVTKSNYFQDEAYSYYITKKDFASVAETKSKDDVFKALEKYIKTVNVQEKLF